MPEPPDVVTPSLGLPKVYYPRSKRLNAFTTRCGKRLSATMCPSLCTSHHKSLVPRLSVICLQFFVKCLHFFGGWTCASGAWVPHA